MRRPPSVAFEQMDTNGNGQLSKFELVRGIESLLPKNMFDRDAIGLLLTAFDDDNND